MGSLHYQIFKAVTGQISGFGIATVYPRKFLFDRALTGSYIVMALGREETVQDPETEDLERAYPVVVGFVQPSNQNVELTTEPDWMPWREQVADYFEANPIPPGLTNVVYDCLVEFGSILDLTAFTEANLDAGFLTLKFLATKDRPAP